MAPEGDVAREDRGAAADDVGFHDGRPDVDEGNRLVGTTVGMVELPLILDGEGVEVNDEGLEPRLLDGGHIL